MIYDQAHLDYSHYSNKSEVNIKEKKEKIILTIYARNLYVENISIYIFRKLCNELNN